MNECIPVMGFCPIGKFVFSHEDAKRQKHEIEQKLIKLCIPYVSIDTIVPDGIIRDYGQVEQVVTFFKESKVEYLFMPHCNFGTESVVGLLGKRLGLPVLVWGPRDEVPLPDGTRHRDTLCGMLASTKVLHTCGVPYTYIENCRVDDPQFSRGVQGFVRSIAVVNRLRGMKIGLVGNRIDFFWSTLFNEAELLKMYEIEVLPIDMLRTIERTKARAAEYQIAYEQEIESQKDSVDFSQMDPKGLLHIYALRDILLGYADEHGLDAIAVESFMTITEELGAMISYAQAMVTDRGIPCITESDILGAVSSILAEAVTLGRERSFFADVTIRHPENPNGFLLWHDAFPLSLKAPNAPAHVGTHWILPDIHPGSCHWRLKEGTVTIIRFERDEEGYSLLAQKAEVIDGPETQNTFVWVEVEDWKVFEKRLIYGPYLHHVACVYGDWTKELEEACRYIPGLRFDRRVY